MQLLPFKPFPYFDWVILGICFLFAVIQPKAAILSLIWLHFAFQYLCNMISIRLVNKPFSIPFSNIQRGSMYFVDFLLAPLYLAGLLFSIKLIYISAKFINSYLSL